MVRFCLLWVLALSLALAVTPARGGEPKPDACQLGQAAMAAGAYEAAIEHFREFLASSVGDPRIVAIRAEMPKLYNGLIARLVADEREDDAARAYIELARLGGTTDEAIVAKGKALLATAMDKANKTNAAARQLRLSEALVELSPGEPAMDEQRAADLRLAALHTMLADRFAPDVLPELVHRWFPKDPPWDKIRSGRHSRIAEVYLRALATRGWHSRLLYELHTNGLGADPAPTATLQDLRERALLTRLEAWAQHGNIPMVKKHLAEAEEDIKTPASAGKVASLRKRLAKQFAAPAERVQLKFDKPITTSGGVWADPGHGFYIDQKVQLGQNDKIRGEVTVRGPFLLDGGTIQVEHGKLILSGTPTAPVVFRNVTIQVTLLGELSATGAIFENCRFQKAPGTWWTGGFSSKWRLSNCLLYRTRFGSLSQVDYGLSINDCAFVECTIPPRVLPDKDLATAYKHSWNQVRRINYIACNLPPSIVWISQESNFIGCTLTGRNDFASTTDHAVAASASCPDDFLLQLRRNTRQRGMGRIQYTVGQRPTPVPAPLFWALLPEYTPIAETK